MADDTSPTPEQLSRMFMLAGESLTIVRQTMGENLSSAEHDEWLGHWNSVIKDLNPEEVPLYIWCTMSLAVAGVTGFIQIVSQVQRLTAEGLLEALNYTPEATEEILKQLPDLSKIISFEAFIQNAMINAMDVAEGGSSS